MLDPLHHLDTDRPADVVQEFRNLSKLAEGDASLLLINEDWDMKGCFTNVPLAEVALAVEWLQAAMTLCGVTHFMAPRRKTDHSEVLIMGGDLKTHIQVSMEDLVTYCGHHNTHCFSLFGARLQHQQTGLPMGSAYSVFLQRAWSTWREVQHYRVYRWPEHTRHGRAWHIHIEQYDFWLL
jgi:hypothetical protein